MKTNSTNGQITNKLLDFAGVAPSKRITKYITTDEDNWNFLEQYSDNLGLTPAFIIHKLVSDFKKNELDKQYKKKKDKQAVKELLSDIF